MIDPSHPHRLHNNPCNTRQYTRIQEDQVNPVTTFTLFRWCVFRGVATSLYSEKEKMTVPKIRGRVELVAAGRRMYMCCGRIRWKNGEISHT
jgi:hypothetical protein